LAAELEAYAEPDATYHSLLDRLYKRVRSLWSILPQPSDALGNQTIAVVGAAGAGKTSVLAKIAMRHGVARERSLGFVCVDPYRVGGVDHLEAYAGLMDAPLRLVDSPGELPEALAEMRSSTNPPELLLIDTAGYPLQDSASQRALQGALSQCGDISVHLTVSATNRAEDIRLGFDAFGGSANSMIFTRLDEASAPGALLDESLRFGLPIAYLTAGQRAAHDLLPADADELTMLAVGGVEAESALSY
jgi:flagellar biosynthesis protein FlhF